MKNFQQLQDEFQRCIMSGDDSVLAEILDSPKEKRDVLFGVYRYAYSSRLVEAIGNDHPYLHTYLGDDEFDAMGKAYVQAKPSEHANLRWYSRGVPDFLKATEPYSDYPAICELAELERALNDVFDATDDDILAIEDIAAVPPESWNDLRFRPHATAKRFDFTSNAPAIWIALKNEETPPDAEVLGEPCRVLVWRQDNTPMFRELTVEEAMMWDEAVNGITFGVLCAMLATYDDPDNAAGRGAGYLRGWVTSGLLSGISIGA